MKLSDYVCQFLEDQGVKDIFILPGGGCIHLVDSLQNFPNIKYWCNLHEQAVAMATEAYARVKEEIGVSLVTTGPGGTNAITGVAGSWMDSVPHLVLSGQAYLKQTIGGTNLRQIGVQEINIIDIVKPMVKYAHMIEDAKTIRYHLEKAIYIAKSGRPGPVWLDFPADITMADIDIDSLKGFDPKELTDETEKDKELAEKVKQTIVLLKESKKPVLYAGFGVRIAGAIKEFIELAEKYQLPILTARNANDIIGSDHKLFIGRPGMFGDRAGNFAIQNSDVLISIGTRLSMPQVGYDYSDFARNAKKVMVDIDKAELTKYTVNPDVAINSDAKEFILELKRQLEELNYEQSHDKWLDICKCWKVKYPVTLPEYKTQNKYVNSYYFVDVLSEILTNSDIVVTDMGYSFQNTHQAFKVKEGQHIFTSSGLASMGYGLPAAIGACVANNSKQVICLSGDGGLQMNIQELQTLAHHKLPVKLFVWSNQGYLTIKKTQEQNWGDRYNACNACSGVSFPDIVAVGKAYGIPSYRIENHEGMKEKIIETISTDGPVICELIMDPDQKQQPMVLPRRKKDGSFEKKTLEDMYPYLDKEEFKENMNKADF